MKPTKNLLLAGLTLLSVGLSVVAWKSFWKAAQLEAAASGLEDEASVRRQLAESERRRRELEALVAGRAALREGVTEVAVKEQAAEGAQERGRGPRGGREAMQATMDRPEMQRLAALQQKAALDTRFAPLFKSLNLSPEKLATLKALLAEKEATMMDTMRAAREQGIDPRSDPEGFKKLLAATQAETNSAIKAAIGESAFAQYEHYQATQPQRNVVSQLQQSLSYTSEPLTTAQAEQLVQVIASAAPTTGAVTVGGPGEGGGGRGGPPGAGGGLSGTGGTAIITTAAVAQAQTVLSATQLQALTQIQQLQQAQQQVQALMRASGGGGRGTGGE